MAASTTVYQFEKFFLEAVTTILAEAGLQVTSFLDDPAATLPRIECDFALQGVQDEPTQMIKLASGRRYQSRYTASINVMIFSSSSASKADHFAQIGRVRNEFSYLQPKLVSPTLPYYQIHTIHEQGSQHGIGDTRDNEFMSMLSFRVVFAIQPSAFAD